MCPWSLRYDVVEGRPSPSSLNGTFWIKDGSLFVTSLSASKNVTGVGGRDDSRSKSEVTEAIEDTIC